MKWPHAFLKDDVPSKTGEYFKILKVNDGQWHSSSLINPKSSSSYRVEATYD